MKIEVTTQKNPRPRPPKDALGFGIYFSDHMFVAEYTEQLGWHHHAVKPYGPLEIDPSATVLHYGQALFEGMKAFRQTDGKVVLFRPRFNWSRMRQGAERLCMQAPDEKTFVDGVKAVLRQDLDWVPSEKGSAMYIRPTLIGTEAFLGVRPSKKYLFYVILSPVGSYYKSGLKPVRIWIEKQYVRATPGGLGETKAGANYAASLKAALNAKANGYDQVLWLDATHKYIEEVGTMNVFFRFKDKVLTPALSGSILEGGTRACVLHLLKSWGVPVEERRISLDELVAAAKSGDLLEAFGTGTAAVITPIGHFAGEHISIELDQNQMGDLAKRLYDEFSQIQYGEKPDAFQWLESVTE